MKNCLLIVIATAGLNAFAASNVCGRVLPCRTFTGPMMENGSQVAEESMTLAEGADADSLIMSGSLKDLTGKRIWEYSYTLSFTVDGDFTVKGENGVDVIKGMCASNICSYAIRPMGGLSTTGTITFKDDVLVRSHANHDAAGDTTFVVSKMK